MDPVIKEIFEPIQLMLDAFANTEIGEKTSKDIAKIIGRLYRDFQDAGIPADHAAHIISNMGSSFGNKK